jgi:hypothetical protein
MESPAVFIPQCQPTPLSSHLATLIPPLRQRMSPNMARPKLPMETERDSPESKADLKERNRLAAQKWRRKKDKWLTELEIANDGLRKQALNVMSQLQALKVENSMLNEELTFFQSFMTKMMESPK